MGILHPSAPSPQMSLFRLSTTNQNIAVPIVYAPEGTRLDDLKPDRLPHCGKLLVVVRSLFLRCLVYD